MKRTRKLKLRHPKKTVSPEVLAKSMSGPYPVIRWLAAIEKASAIFASATSLKASDE